MYRSIPFFYEAVPHIPKEFSYLPIPNIADHYARFLLNMTYNLRDRESKEFVSFPYNLVQVWSEIDEEFRDVFLIHEIVEMQHRVIGKQSKETAHEKAVRRTEAYMNRWLTPEEIGRFNVMLEDLPERKNRRTDVKIIFLTSL